MTKAQALALMNALEQVAMPASASMTFPSAGVEVWSVALDPSVIYTGTQIDQLASYCSSRGLTISAQFSALGIT